MKWILKSAVLCTAFASAAAVADTTLNALFMTQAAYSEDDVKAMTAEFTKNNPQVKVNLEFVPYEALHDKIIAASGTSSGYDVVLFDVVWPAEFSRHKILRDVTDRIAPAEVERVVSGAWSTVSHDGHRYGMPWILDTKYLFYNRDILAKAGITAPPATWDELSRQAKLIKDKGLVKYPMVWSWSQAEAMVCDYTTLALAHQGKLLDGGKPGYAQGGALKAAKYMQESLAQGLTNPNSREYVEEDVRKVFSNGEAAFALNWTYMYAQANDPKESKVAGKVGIAPAPGVAGLSSVSAVNGSMGLGITSASKQPDLAWHYIVHMTSRPVQEKYARLSLPIWKASYDDAGVAKGQEELIAAAKKSLPAMAGRPAAANYTELSNSLQKHLHEALLGKRSVEDAMQAATADATRLAAKP
ncbi:extracellular solute-binding protein [Piscinibacter terrae]|uniref:Extracellular solute-binding protein n=1 Tax=Piscinibacter terrae TaxID=2496871 RepID=A0A3N7HLL7_9BURK|nr:extracellular solute-binding protein [Albitalea terrae]RQP23007.1 extracellular solute-binding protein [Albitalea terrae]